MTIDWATIPVSVIPTALLVYPCHDINPGHLHPDTPDQGPIHVEQLATGHYYIHDGRHRAIRAIEAGDTSVIAKVLPGRA